MRRPSDPASGAALEIRATLQPAFQGILQRSWLNVSARYQLLSQLGRGRQGIVYRARREGSRACETTHALKVFDPSIYSSAEDYRADMGRIATQVSRLHGLRSPNLVNCDFYEECEDVGFVQMEHIAGIELGHFLMVAETRALGFNEVFFNHFQGHLCVQPGIAIHIMREMLSGLETLHAAGYLHCDIEPSNVMIGPLGYVRLIDLGRAQQVGDEAGLLFGTPHYAAPEILAGARPSIRSDLYSVGQVGLELLTGGVLFPERDPSRGILLRRKKELVSDLRARLPSYVARNEEFVNILARLLAPDPDDRYTSAASAEVYGSGLATVHKQLTRMNFDSDYRRDLASFVRENVNAP